MAYFQGAFRSAVLGMDTNVNVILPYDRYDGNGNPGRYDKVLYMLHGLKQNADAWPRMSGIERYANYYGYAVVVPEVQRSFYTDMARGMNYFTYLTEELPRAVQEMFHLPAGRENTYVGGLSMGGYGALKCALTRPDLYAGAMCFSGGYHSLQHPEALMKNYYSRGEIEGILGEELKVRPEDDLEHLVRAFPKDGKKPGLYLACGTEDFLYQSNLCMRDTLRENGFDLTWEAWEGAHDWRFWDVAADRAMKLFAEQR
ncbi:MAG: esterase family protein [Clostridia bacterium]|nr:esterase family protein [Clostridia bacterium]